MELKESPNSESADAAHRLRKGPEENPAQGLGLAP
jgi:hypothetical protein